MFTELQVPTDAVVDGAVTDVSQLRGQTTTAPVLANEQIPVGRLSGGEARRAGRSASPRATSACRSCSMAVQPDTV